MTPTIGIMAVVAVLVMVLLARVDDLAKLIVERVRPQPQREHPPRAPDRDALVKRWRKEAFAEAKREWRAGQLVNMNVGVAHVRRWWDDRTWTEHCEVCAKINGEVMVVRRQFEKMELAASDDPHVLMLTTVHDAVTAAVAGVLFDGIIDDLSPQNGPKHASNSATNSGTLSAK